MDSNKRMMAIGTLSLGLALMMRVFISAEHFTGTLHFIQGFGIGLGATLMLAAFVRTKRDKSLQ